ncbi:hypothetical protein [Tissierella sp.]|uniref:hypothetical protein n=1 Tax=Tissierella sp. TaxID=41274 RepID=UPI00307293A5
MPLPPSVTKVSRDGDVTFTSNVDRAKYSISELSRRALYDIAKFLRKEMILELKKLPGMKRNKRIYNSTQYWVRKKEADLQIGFKHDSWYGAHQELGDRKQPKRGILRNAVYPNIGTIRIITGQYLSAVEDENRLLGLINEGEYTSEEKTDE